MRDYYKILEISKDVEKQGIKKAYFQLVRKFPPDRYPDEFMAIREAYETLIDEHARKQYDDLDALPAVVRLYFDESKKRLENGDAPGAIKLLEKAKNHYPNLGVVKRLLGDAYVANENSGKATLIFEELTAAEPTNAGFIGKLAHVYLMRGWHKKSAERYHQALSLDEDNISLWLGLINSYISAENIKKVKETALKGLEVSKRKGWDQIEFYYHLIQVAIRARDLENMKRYLGEMKNLALINEDEKSNVAWFLANLAKYLDMYHLTTESTAAITAAFELLPENDEIEKIKIDIERVAVLGSQIDKILKDPSIKNVFKAMFEFEKFKCEKKHCLECEFEVFSYEMDVICELDAYIKDIRKIKTDYPELYQLKREFFDSVLNQKNSDKLIRAYQRKMKEFIKLCPEKFDPDDEEYAFCEDDNPEPFVRSEPKVGRNDPCPCGSGKKYKKCCG